MDVKKLKKLAIVMLGGECYINTVFQNHKYPVWSNKRSKEAAWEKGREVGCDCPFFNLENQLRIWTGNRQKLKSKFNCIPMLCSDGLQGFRGVFSNMDKELWILGHNNTGGRNEKMGSGSDNQCNSLLHEFPFYWSGLTALTHEGL